MTQTIKQLKDETRNANERRIAAEAKLVKAMAQSAVTPLTKQAVKTVVRVPVAPVNLVDAMKGTNAQKIANLQSIIAVLQGRLRAAGLEASV